MKKLLEILLVLCTVVVATSIVSASTIVHQASGGTRDAYYEDGIPSTYAFTVKVDSDGSVKGQGEFHWPELEWIFHFEANCLAVDGNTAWIGAVVTRSNDPYLDGGDFTWQIRDNGQGRRANPDVQSTVMRTSSLPLYGLGNNCNYMPDLLGTWGEYEIDHGNFTVW